MARVEELLGHVRSRLVERDVDRLGSAEVENVAEMMVALVPTRTTMTWDELLGPFYGWRAVAAILGGVTPTTVANYRKDHRVLGLRTRDRAWVYPTFQFVRRAGRVEVVAGLREVLVVLVPAADELAAARWLRTANRRLDGRTPIEALTDGNDARVVEAARTQARVWDARSRI